MQTHTGEHLARVAFPLGGIGAGMICLEGTGALSHVSLRHHPQVYHEPMVFAAVCVKGETHVARVLEGPVPGWKIMFPWGEGTRGASGNGAGGKTWGLPRFRTAAFSSRFPFATVRLTDEALPVEGEITGWSPFTPGDADSSSLPVAALEYTLRNVSAEPVTGVFSFHAANFMAEGDGPQSVDTCAGGFVLRQKAGEDGPHREGAFSACVDADDVKVNPAWFRGGWFDPLTMVWNSLAAGETPEAAPIAEGEPSPGGSLFVPFTLAVGEARTFRLRLAWYVPKSDLRCCRGTDTQTDCTTNTHVPWYAERFATIDEVSQYWRERYDVLRERTTCFTECFYDTTLPEEAVEAAAANLSILKSPTVLRQADGRLWAWEGCCDTRGCCEGSCTHVWNYAQALPHLFPELERSLRETEFSENQDDRGHQDFRAALPIRPTTHTFHAAADGQLGGVMKVYRDWRISGDTKWMKHIWPKVKQSLAYCIETWDPDRKGVLVEPHHNTYDIEFWGPDGMCSSFYLGALKAAAAMAQEAGDDPAPYRRLYDKGNAFVETELFNGDYFIQKVQWQHLRAADPAVFSARHWNADYAPEALELLKREGPKYQYGTGCLADGVLGAWIAEVCGVGEILDAEKVERHLLSVYRCNLKHDLTEHANPQRPAYALGNEGGLLLCTWPRDGRPSLPFPYSSEVWTGVEYQVASHLIMTGHVDEGLEIVRTARSRYDGRVRNAFNEFECGHFYARAMSSYALLGALSGARYDAVEQTLTLAPAVAGDFRAFLATAHGFGTVGVSGGKPFLEVRSGTIQLDEIGYDR